IGRVAEWLGRGLQNLVQRFESARDLFKKHPYRVFFFALKLCSPCSITSNLANDTKKKRQQAGVL
ncbi:MAG: hypothetical protein RLZZ358_2234, partial [Bacteroidota bacterium]